MRQHEEFIWLHDAYEGEGYASLPVRGSQPGRTGGTPVLTVKGSLPGPSGWREARLQGVGDGHPG